MNSLIYQKNYDFEPAGAACAAAPWSSFIHRGVECVPSTQTCFRGGVGFRPRVADRAAGALCCCPKPIEKVPEFELYDGPDYCWEMPCNVVVRKENSECGCRNAKGYHMYR